MKQLLIQLFLLLCCGAVSATGVFNVRDFGAHLKSNIDLLCCLMT